MEAFSWEDNPLQLKTASEDLLNTFNLALVGKVVSTYR
jgi:hypothetical protein